MCYDDEFGRFYIKGVGISRGASKLGRAGTHPFKCGRAWPLTNTPIPTWATMPNMIAGSQTVRAYAWISARKTELRVRPFKVTQGYWN